MHAPGYEVERSLLMIPDTIIIKIIIRIFFLKAILTINTYNAALTNEQENVSHMWLTRHTYIHTTHALSPKE
jgi:hypothetical protein